MTQPVDAPTGETLSFPERLIVAPSTGVFRPLAGPGRKPGTPIDRGDIIGEVRSLGVSTAVRSPFAGVLVGLLAVDGQRLRPGQPVAWIRVPFRPR
jgi:[acyl-carrier-protein] S-malonyltransferase